MSPRRVSKGPSAERCVPGTAPRRRSRRSHAATAHGCGSAAGLPASIPGTAPLPEQRARQDRVGCRRLACAQGPILSLCCPEGSRVLSPNGIQRPNTTTLRCVRRSRTASSPAHNASADYPYPALPPANDADDGFVEQQIQGHRCSAERPSAQNTSRSPRTLAPSCRR